MLSACSDFQSISEDTLLTSVSYQNHNTLDFEQTELMPESIEANVSLENLPGKAKEAIAMVFDEMQKRSEIEIGIEKCEQYMEFSRLYDLGEDTESTGLDLSTVGMFIYPKYKHPLVCLPVKFSSIDTPYFLLGFTGGGQQSHIDYTDWVLVDIIKNNIVAEFKTNYDCNAKDSFILYQSVNEENALILVSEYTYIAGTEICKAGTVYKIKDNIFEKVEDFEFLLEKKNKDVFFVPNYAGELFKPIFGESYTFKNELLDLNNENINFEALCSFK